jgi:hypothetical protein
MRFNVHRAPDDVASDNDISRADALNEARARKLGGGESSAKPFMVIGPIACPQQDCA